MGSPSPTAVSDCIELLGQSRLDEERAVIDRVSRLARTLRIALGWHYLLDVVWTNRQIDATPGSLILDAGAGVGIMQWILAEQGVNVLSVDRLDRSRLSVRFRVRYRVAG